MSSVMNFFKDIHGRADLEGKLAKVTSFGPDLLRELAQVVQDAFVITNHVKLPDGVQVITLPLEDGYTTLKILPQVLLYKGDRYGRSGWNSDLNIAYYRDDSCIADAEK